MSLYGWEWYEGTGQSEEQGGTQCYSQQSFVREAVLDCEPCAEVTKLFSRGKEKDQR
jgi:hypothetical protein